MSSVKGVPEKPNHTLINDKTLLKFIKRDISQLTNWFINMRYAQYKPNVKFLVKMWCSTHLYVCSKSNVISRMPHGPTLCKLVREFIRDY